MADIRRMHETMQSGVWIPLEMTSTSETRPKITGFASEHDPAKLYSNLLLQYTNRRQDLFGILETETTHENNIKCQWFEDDRQKGYFCKHGDFVSFVAEEKDIINNFSNLRRILDSFKAKYERTDWTLPVTATTATAVAAVVPQREPDEKRLEQLLVETEKEGREKGWTREQRLQKIADTLKGEKTLTIAALLKADKELHEHDVTTYKEKTTLFKFDFLATPHIHPYEATTFFSRAFLFNNVFIVFDALSSALVQDEDVLLFRPHAFLAYKDGATESNYPLLLRGLEPWLQFPEIVSIATWANGTSKKFSTPNFIIHGKPEDLKISSADPKIGKLVEVFQQGPFVTEISEPAKFKVKTLHFLLKYNKEKPIPSTPEELIQYFEQLQLSLEQQKFIIKQLFPFLQV